MDANRHKLMQGIIKDLLKVPVAKPGMASAHLKPGDPGASDVGISDEHSESPAESLEIGEHGAPDAFPDKKHAMDKAIHAKLNDKGKGMMK